MWIDKINKNKIRKPYQIDNQPMQVWSDEIKLNEFGIYKATVVGSVNTRYYTKTEDVDYNTDTITYTAIPKDLDDVKKLLKSSINDEFKNKQKEPVVDTGLGYSVDSSREALENFKIGKKYALPKVKSADNVFYAVTDTDYDTIIQAIETFGINLYQLKWEQESKVDLLVDIDACITYEHEPYDYTLTAEDVSGGYEDGEVGDVVTRYRDNCKEW